MLLSLGQSLWTKWKWKEQLFITIQPSENYNRNEANYYLAKLWNKVFFSMRRQSQNIFFYCICSLALYYFLQYFSHIILLIAMKTEDTELLSLQIWLAYTWKCQKEGCQAVCSNINLSRCQCFKLPNTTLFGM